MARRASGPPRRELTIREALSLFCEREIARKDERRKRLDRVIQAGLVGAAVAKIVLNQFRPGYA